MTGTTSSPPAVRAAVAGLSERRRVLAGVVGALGLALCSAQAPAAQPAGAVAWPRLRLVDGTEIAPADWRDRSAIVVFWATWCPYCKRHNDRLSGLYAAAGVAAPRVLAVAIDGDLASVRRHVAAQGWTFPVTLDDGRLRSLLAVQRTVPMTVSIGPDGVVRQRIPGEMTEDDLRQLMGG